MYKYMCFLTRGEAIAEVCVCVELGRADVPVALWGVALFWTLFGKSALTCRGRGSEVEQLNAILLIAASFASSLLSSQRLWTGSSLPLLNKSAARLKISHRASTARQSPLPQDARAL